jgi:hypothetical protein
MKIDLSSRLKPQLDRARAYLHGLSAREKWIVGVAAAALMSMGIYQVAVPLQERFQMQAIELEEARRNLESVDRDLKFYYQLKTRRDEIENEYRRVETREGTYSHLERLITTKLGIPPARVSISDRPAQPFGPNYQQTPLSIKFKTSDLGKLVEFLKELAYGKEPLLMTKLDIRKTPMGDLLDVDVEVSSISRASEPERGEKPRSAPGRRA